MFDVMVMVRVNTTQNLTLTLEPNPQNEIVDLKVITNHACTPKKQSRRCTVRVPPATGYHVNSCLTDTH